MLRFPSKTFSRSGLGITATLDARTLSAALERLRQETGKDAIKLVKESARRVAVDLARRSFPKTFLDGKNSIENDVRAVYPTRREVAENLNEKRPKLSRQFFFLLSKNPTAAIALAEKFGVQIEQVDQVSKEVMRAAVRYNTSASGGRAQRTITPPSTIQLLRNSRAITTYVNRVSKRVGTAATGWSDASRDFGAARSADNLDRFKKARRPMKCGVGMMQVNGGKAVAIITNSVEYSNTCISQQALDYAIDKEIVNLNIQATYVLRRRISEQIGRANAS